MSITNEMIKQVAQYDDEKLEKLLKANEFIIRIIKAEIDNRADKMYQTHLELSAGRHHEERTQ